jgi:tetratricopeptide (TPR) repeat protein
MRQERFASAVDAFTTYGAAYDEADLALVALRTRALLENGDSEEAIASLERAVSRNSGNQSLMLLLVEAQLRAGQAEAAAESLRGIPELGGNAEIIKHVGTLIAAMQDGGREAGAAHIDALIAGSPDDAAAHSAAAFYRQMNADFDGALASIDTALRLDPNLVAGYIMRGALLQRTGEADLAKAAYDSAIALAPDNATALAARALIAVTERDYGRGGELFGRAFAASDDFAFLASHTVALRLAGDAAWSASLRNWLTQRPRELTGRLFLATQSRFAGDYAGAVSVYEQVLAVDANNLEALNNAAWLAAELDREEALVYARRAEALAPDNGAILDTLGWVLVRRSMVVEGLPYLERANQLLPETAEIQYHLGVAQLESGDGAAARITLDRALSGALPSDLRRAAERLVASL